MWTQGHMGEKKRKKEKKREKREKKEKKKRKKREKKSRIQHLSVVCRQVARYGGLDSAEIAFLKFWVNAMNF